ncbi:MAG TPA: ABC transporter substrate-binding protein [Actinomycetota bacterium]
MIHGKTVRFAALVMVLGLVATACGGDGDGDTGQGKTGGTFVFGASADPVSLDGAFVSDGESIRVIYQVFEGLVRTEDGGFKPVPSLATKWDSSADGKVWTFTLREGVKFHDGTDFNGEAVCFNFNRWFNFKGLLQSDAVSYYWKTVFGGFSDKPADSLFKSCAAPDAKTAVIELTKPSASFLSGLVLANFSIASPTALQKYEADKVSGTEEAPSFDGTYGLAHPTGTGPFKFVSFAAKDRLVLERNDDYWGEKAKFDRVIFRAIADAAARRTALETGEIHAYDNPSPDDIATLQNNFNVEERPPFNVGYIGFNVKIAPFDNLKIRQAVAHAINKEALLTAKYPPGAEAAIEFQPPDLFGWNGDVAKYAYDVNKAKQLIAESGLPQPVTLEFLYPTDVSRGYMPDPSANFQAFKSDLEAAGFRVTPKSAPWNPDYLNQVQSGKAGMYLLGWLADFGDPDNFVGVFFQQYSDQFGFTEQAIFDKLNAAEIETDEAKRTDLYKEANKLIMDFVPGVPYVHTATFAALSKKVQGFVPSPISLERYSIMSLS